MTRIYGNSAPDKNAWPAKKFLGREIEVGKT
jgi:hypothetical protein